MNTCMNIFVALNSNIYFHERIYLSRNIQILKYLFKYLSHTGSAQYVQHTIVINAAQNGQIQLCTPNMCHIFRAQIVHTKKMQLQMCITNM